jgi:hypothetical protein
MLESQRSQLLLERELQPRGFSGGRWLQHTKMCRSNFGMYPIYRNGEASGCSRLGRSRFERMFRIESCRGRG